MVDIFLIKDEFNNILIKYGELEKNYSNQKLCTDKNQNLSFAPF